ncbi:MAG: hypothetical protein LIP16_04125 [Clostridium sp.]|nr:hypothetical protein [Clostridium sp.]
MKEIYEASLPAKCRFALERTGLLEEIRRTEETVLIFRALAGFGKTQLARQFCEQWEGRVVWTALDGRRGLEDSLGAGMDRLAKEMEEGEKNPCLLVFDCLEQGAGGRLCEKLYRLAASLPEGGKLLLLTRGYCPEFLSRFRMNGQCRIWDQEDLAFTREETGRLAEKILGRMTPCRQEMVGECHDTLAGWPSLLALALLELKKSRWESYGLNWPLLMETSMMNSFLSWELAGSLTREEEDFLTRTCGMDRLEEGVCDKVLGIDNSRHIMDGLLVKQALRCHPSGETAAWAGAIRLFFKGRAGDDWKITACKVAEYYLEKGDYPEAARLALELCNRELVLKTLKRFGDEMLKDGDGSGLEACICYLEDGGLPGVQMTAEQNPALMTEVLGIAAQFYYKTGRPGQMEACLNQADSAFGKENKYGMYRGLYKGLLKFKEDPDKYTRQIHNARFFLEENGCPLPYLKERELEILRGLERSGKETRGRRLRVSMFGEFSVEALEDHRLLSWRTRKGGELFACLIELDGQAVGRRQLLQKLWEDQLPDNAITMLHNMFYNIRKELSAYNMAGLIQYKDKMYSISMEELETDLPRIRRICGLVEKKKLPELLKCREDFRRFWGHYLENMDSGWISQLREYYDMRFYDGCMLLAGDAMNRGDYEETAVFLKNALLINSYSQEAVGKLLMCYGAMGNLKQVKAEYQRFAALLKEDLGLGPDRKLWEIYQQALGCVKGEDESS